jgi:hypothetical protein
MALRATLRTDVVGDQQGTLFVDLDALRRTCSGGDIDGGIASGQRKRQSSGNVQFVRMNFM